MSTNSSRLVVVGCNGFIGKNLCHALETSNINYIGISKENCDLIDGSSVSVLRKILRPNDTIVFNSAITPSKNSDDFNKTIQMAINFKEAISQTGNLHIILISSDSVYGDLNGLITEDTPCNPDSFHGLAQLSRELILKSITNCNLAILRLCAVYGPGDTHNSYGPNRFMRQLLSNKSIEIFGEGKNKRDHVFIQDVINLIIKCKDLNYTGIINVASGKSYTFNEVSKLCQAVYNKPANEMFVGSEGRIFEKTFDITKLTQVFPGFQPTQLREGLVSSFPTIE